MNKLKVLLIRKLGGSIATAVYLISKPPEDPSITQKNNEAIADYCTALLEQNKELRHALRHCYNAMSELEDITRELEEYL
ncbi:MAG: hypothetical protein IJM87_10720 [Ruminococcus sp.]|nr:hypothetical protein [Ruminococcus sp.]